MTRLVTSFLSYDFSLCLPFSPNVDVSVPFQYLISHQLHLFHRVSIFLAFPSSRVELSTFAFCILLPIIATHCTFKLHRTQPNLPAKRPPCRYRNRISSSTCFSMSARGVKKVKCNVRHGWSGSHRLQAHKFFGWILVLRSGNGGTKIDTVSAKFKNMLVRPPE